MYNPIQKNISVFCKYSVNSILEFTLPRVNLAFFQQSNFWKKQNISHLLKKFFILSFFFFFHFLKNFIFKLYNIVLVLRDKYRIQKTLKVNWVI